MGKIEIRLEIEKQTKNTYRYREIAEDTAPVVGTLYLQKWAAKQLNGGEVPRAIKVTIEPL